MFSIMRLFDGKHGTGKKCVKQMGAPFTVFTKLYHVSSSATVKVVCLYRFYIFCFASHKRDHVLNTPLNPTVIEKRTGVYNCLLNIHFLNLTQIMGTRTCFNQKVFFPTIFF